MSAALAYHITFGTYGTRLHGDARGTVSRDQNTYGEPIIGRDIRWEAEERTLLRFPPVFLKMDQRLLGESRIPAICERGGWRYQIAACQADHVHVLLTSDREGEAVRKWLKRWLGEDLSEQWPTALDQSWWAEGGSVKRVFDEAYFHNVFEYIRSQRATP